jgi:translation elongation factor P/translation initiation factor 5A
METYENIYKKLIEDLKVDENDKKSESQNDNHLNDIRVNDTTLINLDNYLQKKPIEIRKNDIIILDNKECNVIDISFSRQVKNQQFIFHCIRNNNGEKIEKLFKFEDIVWCKNTALMDLVNPNNYIQKKPSEIYKNDIIIVDNKECNVKDIYLSNEINNRKFLFNCIKNDNGEKIEATFNNDKDIVWCKNII